VLVIGDEVVAWVVRKTGNTGSFGAAVGIGWEFGGRLVAGVAYTDYNGANIGASIAVDHGHIAREYLRIIFDYPFNQCRVKRITATIGEGNKKSVNLVQRFGFTYETRLSEAHSTGDLLIYRMFRNECRWLSLKGNQNEQR
jgi:RimJ/RimL family protein N-acetyltransferase